MEESERSKKFNRWMTVFIILSLALSGIQFILTVEWKELLIIGAVLAIAYFGFLGGRAWERQRALEQKEAEAFQKRFRLLPKR